MDEEVDFEIVDLSYFEVTDYIRALFPIDVSEPISKRCIITW